MRCRTEGGSNEGEKTMKQMSIVLTPEQGKKLIARAVASLPEVETALETATIVVIAGTTNRYVAEELLKKAGEPTDTENFYRGITLPRGVKLEGGIAREDVVIEKGKRVRGKTIFDVAGMLKPGDLIIKGGNAVHLASRQAAVLVGNPAVGTTLPIIEAVYGRRVGTVIPVGVEKRVELPIPTLAALSTDGVTAGPRLCPLPGEAFTELDAIPALYDLEAEIFAAGGVMGAEGAVYFLCSGREEDLKRLSADIAAL